MSQHDFLRQAESGHNLGQQTPLLTRWHIDPWLISLLLLLTGCGLFVLYSASDRNLSMVIRQTVYLGISFVVMIGIAQLSPRFLSRCSPWLYAAGLLMLVAVLVVGDGAKGAQRWLAFGSFRFQPSEVLKLVMPVVISAWVSRQVLPPGVKAVVVTLILIAMPVALIAKQPDLGTSLLVGASGVFVLLLAGLRKRVIFSAALAAIPALWVLWNYLMKAYQKQRVLTFLNPESDPWGSGWNIIQSKIAIGSGGVYGKGWLLGTQSHLDFLPESHTDFILAVLAEEFGLAGVLVLLTIYAFIIGRGVFIAMNAQTVFGRLLAGSITLTFFVYLFVNIGMVSGILPVVGVPLPLVSRGGTSLVTLMAGFGMLMSVHTHRNLLARG
ncbi:rod shape-determining protein RodA [Endozoicomonadaceae bacterium StTr2]